MLEAQVTHLAEWEWTVAPGGQQQQAVHTRPLKAKLEELKITHEIVWESGPGKDTRERVEAIKRWFVHDWQNLDNKIKSSIVEGVSVFLSMFDMPDVAKVFCPAAPHITDDPQAIILQAQIKRLKADKDAAELWAGVDQDWRALSRRFSDEGGNTSSHHRPGSRSRLTLTPWPPTPMKPSVMRLLGATFPSLPRAEAGIIAGPTDRAANPAARCSRVRRPISDTSRCFFLPRS